MANAPEGAYLKAVRMGNFDRLATGLESEPGGDPPAMEVVLSTRGGGVNGRAVTADPQVVASGATVMLIPDPQLGRRSVLCDHLCRRIRQFPGERPGSR